MALNTKTTAKKRSIQKKRSLSEFFTNRNRKIGIGLILALVAVGVYFLFFASAATNNCQAENGVQICDVDQTAGGGDSVLSLYGEAESLGNQGWGTYFGTAFRAPTTTYDGAVPVHRFLNPSASWHEFTTDAQLGQKEAAAGGRDKLTYEGIVFYAWTDGHRAGTVPVYRITRLGAETQSMFSTDKAWIDKMVAGPWGWTQDVTMPGVAFYAYPPGYAVAQQINPYDCSILENFTSPRCAKAAENLGKEIAAGNVPATSECPKDWASWNKALFPDKFEQACRDKWNGYAQNCSNPDVFLSDRCKKEREALIAANEKQIAERKKAAEAEKAKIAKKTNPKTSSTTKSGGGGGGGNTNNPSSPPPIGANGCPVGMSKSAREGCVTTTQTVKGPNGCPVGMSKSAREGCVRTSPVVTLPAPTGPISTDFICSISWAQERTWPFQNSKKEQSSTKAFNSTSYNDAKTWCKGYVTTFLSTRTRNYLGNVVDSNSKSNCNGGISQDPCRMYGIEAGLVRYGQKERGTQFYYQNVYEHKKFIY